MIQTGDDRVEHYLVLAQRREYEDGTIMFVLRLQEVDNLREESEATRRKTQVTSKRSDCTCREMGTLVKCRHFSAPV